MRYARPAAVRLFSGRVQRLLRAGVAAGARERALQAFRDGTRLPYKCAHEARVFAAASPGGGGSRTGRSGGFVTEGGTCAASSPLILPRRTVSC